VGGTAVPLGELATVLVDADLVVSCTGAVGNVIDAPMVTAAQAQRGGRPVVLLDLALPRDVDLAVHGIDGVRLVDLETLSEVLATHERNSDVEAAKAIVVEEVAGFLGWQRAVSVAPTVVALRGMADAVVHSELERLSTRLPDLDTRSRAEIELTVQRVVEKVLHAPTVRVKQLAEQPGGHTYADALSKLFGLDPKAVEAVTRPDIDDSDGLSAPSGPTKEEGSA
jgi:glutamyl-tRNA reductase